jgi:hypothetical protein
MKPLLLVSIEACPAKRPGGARFKARSYLVAAGSKCMKEKDGKTILQSDEVLRKFQQSCMRYEGPHATGSKGMWMLTAHDGCDSQTKLMQRFWGQKTLLAWKNDSRERLIILLFVILVLC